MNYGNPLLNIEIPGFHSVTWGIMRVDSLDVEASAIRDRDQQTVRVHVKWPEMEPGDELIDHARKLYARIREEFEKHA